MHTEGQECMKVLKRVDEDLTSLGGKVTRRKVELVALEKKVQKQDLKILKLMEHIDSALEHINDLEDLAERRDKRIQALEEEVEELKLKVCRCKGKEREIDVPECQGRPQLASLLTMTKGFEVLDGVKADLSI